MKWFDNLTDEGQAAVLIVILLVEAFLLWG